MSKLYVFGIGGTGARVLKSLSFSASWIFNSNVFITFNFSCLNIIVSDYGVAWNCKLYRNTNDVLKKNNGYCINSNRISKILKIKET